VSDLKFSENAVHNGQARGVRVLQLSGGPPATRIALTCNSISGNALAGLELLAEDYTGTLDAPVNWWGHASGPAIESNAGGTGQQLVDAGGHVAYTPFLVDGTDGDPLAPGFQCGPAALSVADVTGAEGTGGAPTLFDFAVTLSHASASTVTVAYATADGTASAGSDYSSSSGTLTFAPGERSKTVSVPVTADAADEPDETFQLRLLSPSGAPVTDGEASATIQDDDLPPADARKPKVGLAVVKGSRLRKALSKGLALNLRTDEVGVASVVARVAKARVGSTRRTLTRTGRHRVVIKFGAKQRRKFKERRRLRLSLKATVADAAGNLGAKTLTVTLRR
jgi:hypothetical protein